MEITNIYQLPEKLIEDIENCTSIQEAHSIFNMNNLDFLNKKSDVCVERHQFFELYDEIKDRMPI